MNGNNQYLENLIEDPKIIINKSMILFLFNLFKYIFIKYKKPPKLERQLIDFIDIINDKIIQDKNKYISLEYSKKNIENIILFVKIQNQIFAGEIIEGILIFIFSEAFYSDKDNTFGKYIYSNLFKFKESNNYDILSMFKQEKFAQKELNNLKQLLLIDATADDNINHRVSEQQKESIFFHLLSYIFIEKYVIIKNESNKKAMFYINRGDFENQKISNDIYDKLKDISKTVLDKDISVNSIMSLSSLFYYSNGFGRIINAPLRLIKNFLIQVFIYYQNKNSPLMSYTYKKDDFEIIPFDYDLRGACVEGKYAYVILAPIRIEPRVNKISLSQNNLRECGFFEIGKNIIFNKGIKNIEYNTSLVRTNYIDYLNRSLGIFDNFSVESLNLSFNYLKENCEEYMAKLLSRLKGLKTLILTSNEYKKGLSSSFIVLKKLYREKKINLEVLVLNKCLLDDSSYYELGELVKCKYCKLKKLYLNFDTLPYNINFIKKLKKNKSLTEIYLNKTDIGNNDVDDILRVINNTDIRYLYLFKNRITNFSDFLRIIYRTKIIEDNNKIDEDIILTNLDLSNSDLYIKNYKYISLLLEIIKKTGLYCLDISHILYGPSPNKKEIKQENKEYRKKVDELESYLKKDKEEYVKTMKEITNEKVNIKRYKSLEKEKVLTNLDVNEIINNKMAKQPVFLKQQAKNIIMSKKNKDITEEIFVNNIIDRNKYKIMHQKIENYMHLKRAEKNFKILEEKRKKKKLIII